MRRREPGAGGRGRPGAFFLTPLGIVFTTVLIDLIGFGIVLPLVPLYAEEFGASPIVIGLLTGSYALMQLIFAPIWGRVSYRVGRRPVILVTLLGSAIAWLIFGLAGALWVLFLARILDGISGASYAAAQAYVADITSDEERVRGMGLIGAAFGLGFIIGPAMGAGFAAIDHRLPFLVASGLALLNLAVAWRRLPESRKPGPRAPQPGQWQQVRGALGSRELAPMIWLSFVATFAFVAMEATFALFGARRFDFGLAETGLVFTFIGVVAALSQGFLVHRLVGRHGQWRVLQWGLLGTAVSFLLLAATEQVWALFPVLLLLAGASGLVFPTVTTIVSRRTDEHHQGGTLGVLASTGGLARLLAPVAATALFQEVGVGAPLVVGGVLFLACAGLAATRTARLETGKPQVVGETPAREGQAAR
jgi:multidrug resistance protein